MALSLEQAKAIADWMERQRIDRLIDYMKTLSRSVNAAAVDASLQYKEDFTINECKHDVTHTRVEG